MYKYSYRPPRSAREIKADELTQTVRAIVEKEEAEFQAKLTRLRLARAERDAAAEAVDGVKPRASGGKKVGTAKSDVTSTPSVNEGAAHAKPSVRQ